MPPRAAAHPDACAVRVHSLGPPAPAPGPGQAPSPTPPADCHLVVLRVPMGGW